MLHVDKISIMNIDNALRGARNPMNSWDKSDSYYDEKGTFVVGEKDLDLAQRLCKAGSDHRKFIRQIFVTMDINAPLYFWKEFDTYKVGTVANSTSTMHKIHTQPFAIEQFSHDQMTEGTKRHLEGTVSYLEAIRLRFLETKAKEDWYDMIQLLPSSYNQLRTCTMNYEVLGNMYHNRKNHKLKEWHVLCDAIKALPYAKQMIIITE